MRLSEHEREVILRTAREVFGPDADVRLFGSRVRDEARGGDIDLYVEAAPERATLEHELRFVRLLHERLGEQRIDVVVHGRGTAPGPFARRAAAESVPL